MNNLVIVAHPDDETLFMGGTLAKRRKEYWKIVCVTTDIEHGRDPQFVNVCKLLQMSYSQLGFKMGWKPHVPKWDMTALGAAIRDLLLERKWDRVWTHNKVGEYGHPQHKLVYEAVWAQ